MKHSNEKEVKCMGCQNYNPIAAAHASENGTEHANFNSALYGQWNCNCCEMGAIYTTFGNPIPMPSKKGKQPNLTPDINI